MSNADFLGSGLEPFLWLWTFLRNNGDCGDNGDNEDHRDGDVVMLAMVR